eukprot:471611-Alexandrium_andersonii.AAC.1
MLKTGVSYWPLCLGPPGFSNKLRLHGDNDAQRFYDQWIEHASGLEPGIPARTIREILYEQLKN